MRERGVQMGLYRERERSGRLQFLPPGSVRVVVPFLLVVGQRAADLAVFLLELELDALTLHFEIDFAAFACLGLEVVPLQRLEQRIQESMSAAVDRREIRYVRNTAPGGPPCLLTPALAFFEPCRDHRMRTQELLRNL